MKKAIIIKDIRKQDKVDVGVALDGHPVGTAVRDSDGEQLGHCDVGIMLGALVGNALGVDVGAVLGALVGNALGRQDGLVFWLAEGEQDGHPVGTAVGDSDGEQLGH